MPHAHALGSLRASFSCGVATFPDYQSTSALIEAADNALLQAKRDGRNRVLKAGPADHTSVA
jgi:PleD family two-component response regulator